MANGTNRYSFETTKMSSYFLFAILSIFLDLRFFHRLLLQLSSDKMWLAVALTYKHVLPTLPLLAGSLLFLFLNVLKQFQFIIGRCSLRRSFHVRNDSDKLKSIRCVIESTRFFGTLCDIYKKHITLSLIHI